MAAPAHFLLRHFDRLAEAPGGLVKLRALILQLAVQGKLLSQNPADEPAAQLLNQVQAEKSRLTRIGKICQEQPLPSVDKSTLPFDLPVGWSWTRLGAVSELVTSGSRDWARFYSKDGAIFVRMGNLSQDSYQLRLDKIQRVNPPAEGEGSRTKLEEGDILISITGEVGWLGLIPKDFGDAYINQHVCLVRPMSFLKNRYLAEFFRSPFAQAQFNEPQRGIKNSFRLTDVTQLLVPLPPLAEQRRIVTKVEELMGLCDALEAAQHEREAVRMRLRTSALHRLASPDSDSNSAAFVLQNFPRFTSEPEDLADIRQSVRQLAVEGRLVPQTAADENVQSLIAHISATRNKLIALGKLAKHTPMSSVSDKEQSFALPKGWAWVRFGNLTFCRDGERIPISSDERKTRARTYDYYGASGVIDKIDGFLFDKPLLLIGEDGANLINRSTPIAYIARGKYWVNNHAHVLDGISEEFLQFLELSINAINLEAYVTGTAQPKMNQAKMNSIPIPLPPLAEQRRIVAKVDELMAVLDALEATLTTARTTAESLLAATIAKLHAA